MAEDISRATTDRLAPAETLHSRRTVTLILAGLLAGLLLAFMDVTIVSTAGPTIISELGGLSLYAWVFSAFLIVQVVTIPIFGKLSDLYGRKRLFLLGVVVFMAGCALAGGSQNIPALSRFRAGLGSAALAGLLGLLMFGLFLGGATIAWESWAEVGIFAGSALLFVAFVLAERRAREPVLPPRLFRIRNVSAATAVNMLRAVVFFGIIAYLPLFAQAVLGGTVGDVRNVIYGFTLPLTGGILLSGAAISKIGFKKPTFIGATIVVAGLVILTSIRPSPSLLQLIVIGIPLGFGNGMMIPATIVAFQNSVEKGEIGIASGLSTFTLYLGGAIGLSILGAIQTGVFDSLRSSLLTPALVRDTLSQSILLLFWIFLGVSLVTLAATLLMRQMRTDAKASVTA